MRALLSLGVAALLWVAAASAQDPADPIAAEIAARGVAQVIVEVIVDVDVPAPADEDDTTPAAAFARRQQDIATGIRILRAELAGAGIDIQHAFVNVPQVTARVNAAQLDHLRRHPKVRAVLLDRPRAQRQTTSPTPGTPSDTRRFVKADVAWAHGQTGKGALVIVLDDGIDARHEMFVGRIQSEACFSLKPLPGDQSLCPNGATESFTPGAASLCPTGTGTCRHGTHVAGIIAGASATLRGVAYEADLLPIQVFTSTADPGFCGSGRRCLTAYDSSLLKALDYALTVSAGGRLAAVNLSIGGEPTAGSCDDNPLRPAIEALRQRGVLTTLAAGNEGQTGLLDPPGCISSAITVSSVMVTDPDPSANHARDVDLLAPGSYVTSAVPGTGTYAVLSGSSMATAHVAGAVAILKAARLSATATDIETALESGGIATRGNTWSWTTPRLDVAAALDRLQGVVPAPPGVAVSGIHTGRNAFTQSFLRFHNAELAAGSVTLHIHAEDGTRLGTWSATIPALASPQYAIQRIEAEAVPRIQPSDPLASYTIYVDATMSGHVQHVLWNPQLAILTNGTTCAHGLSADLADIINVHTGRIGAYPSLLRVHNTGDAAAQPRLSVHDARNGQSLGTLLAPTAIPARGTATYSLASLLAALSPGPEQFHVNLRLEAGFSGFAQHVVQSTASGALADMSAKCDL